MLALLLDRPLPLRSFPQRMGACFLLREVLESGPASRDELNRRVDRFRQVVVLRPDGYLAWVLSGHTQQKAGPGQVEFNDGVFKANGFVLGQFYSGRRGAYRPVDAQMEPLRDSDILGEVYDDSDLFGRTMDGAGEAFFALAMAVGKFLSRPLDGVAELRNLPAGVAALIASSPEYLERFKLMSAGEQIQAVSRLSTTLLTMFAGGSAVSASVTRGLGGMEVAGLSLSAQGTLVLGRVVVPAGAVATVFTAGAGAPVVLQSTATGKELTKEAQRAIHSLERRIAEHEKKLADFKANPTVRPGMEGQPKEIIEAAQQSRIKHLEREIQTFRENIKKLQGGE